jgi:hypothetical protein
MSYTHKFTKISAYVYIKYKIKYSNLKKISLKSRIFARSKKEMSANCCVITLAERFSDFFVTSDFSIRVVDNDEKNIENGARNYTILYKNDGNI